MTVGCSPASDILVDEQHYIGVHSILIIIVQRTFVCIVVLKRDYGIQ